MMKKLVLILCMMYTGNAFAQYKCKLVTNETDPFTNAKIKVTEQADIDKGDQRSTSMNVAQNGDDFALNFAMGFFSDQTTDVFDIEKGLELMIQLANSDTVILRAARKNEGRAKQVVQYGSAKTWQNISNEYPMSLTQVEKLNASPLKLVRVYVLRPDGKKINIDAEPHAKLNGVLMQMIDCVKSQ